MSSRNSKKTHSSSSSSRHQSSSSSSRHSHRHRNGDSASASQSLSYSDAEVQSSQDSFTIFTNAYNKLSTFTSNFPGSVDSNSRASLSEACMGLYEYGATVQQRCAYGTNSRELCRRFERTVELLVSRASRTDWSALAADVSRDTEALVGHRLGHDLAPIHGQTRSLLNSAYSYTPTASTLEQVHAAHVDDRFENGEGTYEDGNELIDAFYD